MTDPIAPRLDGMRVLLVEDDYIIAIELARGLEELGAEIVGPVGTVADALRLIERAGGLDAAVLDVNLGGELAYPIADAIAARRLPYVLATGYDELVIPPPYARAPRCEKPVDMVALADLLAARRPAAQG